jgi:Holliday junction resolvase RusA-like endonuclease
MDEVEFKVPGRPQGKARPRFVKRGGRTFTYTPKTTASYEKLVAKCFYDRIGGNIKDACFEGALQVDITAVFAPPKSTSLKQRKTLIDNSMPYEKKPDCDNIAKTILDGLNQAAYKDDKQVVKLSVSKTYGVEECCIVRLKKFKKN